MTSGVGAVIVRPMPPNHHHAIAERLRKVLDSGRVESASAWSMAAGLSRTYVSAFIERVKKGIISDLGVNTLAALAEIAHVNPAWLAYGIGPVDEGPPNLRKLLKRLPAGTYSAELVLQAMMIREVIHEPDMPESAWQDYLDGLRKEARRVGLAVAASKLDEHKLKG